MRRFDLKFGPDFLATVPSEPGVYRFLDAADEVVYVGKASDLKRRLTQYRNAGTTRRGRKPHRIMKDAVSLAFETFPTELDASLEEVRLIQRLHPRHNVASAYEFLYPFIGLMSVRPARWSRTRDLALVLSSRPELFPELAFHGCYRGRETVALGFFALTRLLRHLGHQEPRARWRSFAERDPHARVIGLRRLPEDLIPGLAPLLEGRSLELVADLAVRLLEVPSACARADEVQADLDLVATFFGDEARPLREAIEATAFPTWPVTQAARDPLFLRFRALGPERLAG